MDLDQWTAVDRYITDILVPSDPALDEALRANEAAGLPSISVAPNQGKLLHLLARLRGARTILEIGTLGGYSTIWMARALPADGRLITMEFDPKHAEVASENIANAGLADMIELREGKALELLPELAAEGLEAFDLIFIDADKCNNLQYFEWALRLSRKGSGCGLGLSIVQFIVTAHNGSVSVESQPGRGSTFMISVPAAPAPAHARKEAIA